MAAAQIRSTARARPISRPAATTAAVTGPRIFIKIFRGPGLPRRTTTEPPCTTGGSTFFTDAKTAVNRHRGVEGPLGGPDVIEDIQAVRLDAIDEVVSR